MIRAADGPNGLAANGESHDLRRNGRVAAGDRVVVGIAEVAVDRDGPRDQARRDPVAANRDRPDLGVGVDARAGRIIPSQNLGTRRGP